MKPYSSSYHEARQRFLTATADADIHCSDTIVDDLTIDTAIYEAPDPHTVLVIVSGTHGVEGYSGSAVQLHFLDRFRSRLNDRTTLVLIHALNPYGFAHDTRVNHHRVDLNRTFCDRPEACTTGNASIDAAFDTLYPLLTPKRPRGNERVESLRFYANIVPTVLRSKITGTYGALKNAIAGGQYRYPDAPFYGGKGDEPEVAIFHRILSRISEGYERLLLLDCHTGLGRRGEAVYVSANPPDSDPFRQLQKVEPAFSSIVADDIGDKEAYDASGTLIQYALRHSRAKSSSVFAIDIGTIPALPLLKRIVAENQVHHHPETPEPIARKVRHDFREGFYPSETKWRDDTLKIYHDFLEKLLKSFQLIKEQPQ